MNSLKLVLFVVLALTCVGGCEQRGRLTYAPEAAGIGEPQEIFISTTRAIDPETGDFGGDRNAADSFGRYVVQVPPDRIPGSIEWPRRGMKPDPRTQFLTVERKIYSGSNAFRKDLARAIRARPPGGREVIVFAHGFNTTFSEGLYRIAQVEHDLQLPAVIVHYSWPSRGSPLAYITDRDSAIFARDGYEDVLNQIAAAGAERIVLVGHSMGALLTMEALRQVAIDENSRVLPRLGGVILLSPDIDVDIFHQQAVRIGKLPQPFFVFTSQRDKALAISARLTGERERLGNLTDASRLADLDITLVDVSAFRDGTSHFTAGTSPALLGVLGRLGDVYTAYGSERAVRPGLVTGTVLTIRNATRVILRPVEGIAEGLER